jgi:Phospholipase_D-nuclease N-terminal
MSTEGPDARSCCKAQDCQASDAGTTSGAENRYGRFVLVRLLIAAAVVIFLALWVRAVIDVFRRRDLTAAAKSAWAIIMLLVPFIGLLVYTLLRPSDAQVAQRAPR